MYLTTKMAVNRNRFYLFHSFIWLVNNTNLKKKQQWIFLSFFFLSFFIWLHYKRREEEKKKMTDQKQMERILCWSKIELTIVINMPRYKVFFSCSFFLSLFIPQKCQPSSKYFVGGDRFSSSISIISIESKMIYAHQVLQFQKFVDHQKKERKEKKSHVHGKRITTANTISR